jgi:DNA-binding response OmpR family regulator
MLARETNALAELSSALVQDGFICSVVSRGSVSIEKIASYRPDLVMMEMDGSEGDVGVRKLAQKIMRDISLPVIALLDRDKLSSINGNFDVDDFIISPYEATELELRIKRLLKLGNRVAKSGELIESGGLVIDLAECEVTVDGRAVELAFREYELLRFLASNRGRVYNRGQLLDKVWGYDYYGGDRTVDVHVRRLRSKIEVSQTFIETVRNIGYRFKKDV